MGLAVGSAATIGLAIPERFGARGTPWDRKYRYDLLEGILTEPFGQC
jgi:hypothetical protein